MKNNSLIRIEHVCINCQTDITFIQALHELGHIELINKEEDHFINEAQLKSLESLIYFHTQLHINIEGIDAIAHLLNKVHKLQNELIITKSKLNFYSEA